MEQTVPAEVIPLYPSMTPSQLTDLYFGTCTDAAAVPATIARIRAKLLILGRLAPVELEEVLTLTHLKCQQAARRRARKGAAR